MGGTPDAQFVVLALFALLLAGMSIWSRIAEHWGLGTAPKGSFRAPHGRLASVRIVEGQPFPRRLRLFGRCLAASWIAAAALVALDVYLTQTLPAIGAISGLGFWCSALAVAVGARSMGLRQAVLYGCAGYALFGVVLMLPVALLEYAFDLRGVVLYVLANLAAITGTCLGVALAPQRLRFERTFEDGTVDRIWVSARASAYARLSELARA